MEAMILAAGLGTRLRPITDRVPKALIEVGGVPVLEHVAARLIEAGADRLVINVHHLGERIREFVDARRGWGVEVRFSEEREVALETGGGVLAAFRSGALSADAPFLLHNSDILTDMPLDTLYERHHERRPIATLAVMERETSRYLLFDEEGLLGRVDEGRGVRIEVRAAVGRVERLAFGGVHVVDDRFPRLVTEEGAFSILDPYLRLVQAGERVEGYRVDSFRWIDIGKPEQLREAQAMFGG